MADDVVVDEEDEDDTVEGELASIVLDSFSFKYGAVLLPVSWFPLLISTIKKTNK